MRRLVTAFALALAPLLASPAPPRQDPAPEKSSAQLELERVSARIAGQLAALRGLEFVRPFEVRVASAADFLEHAKQRTAEAMPPERLAAVETMQKMLGLLPADLDLLAVTFGVLEEQVGGFYDPGQDTFYLMEGFQGPVAELILAHELAHALDDQHFDLDSGLGGRHGSSDSLSAYHALVEGSGMVMMTRWMLAHPPRLGPRDLETAMPSPASLGKAPAAIWKPLLFAYLQGQNFLESGRRMLRRRDRSVDANAALDAAFASPPRSTQQVLHPEKYWDPERRDEPRAVSHDLAALPAGWELLLDDTLGELLLALVVEEPVEVDLSNQLALMGLRYTHPAVEAWDGDQALLLGRADGARLLALAVVVDGAREAELLREALDAARGRIEPVLAALAGEVGPQGSAVWIGGERGDLVRFVSYTGVGPMAALELARGLPVSVGPDPLEGPADPAPAGERAEPQPAGAGR